VVDLANPHEDLLAMLETSAGVDTYVPTKFTLPSPTSSWSPFVYSFELAYDVDLINNKITKERLSFKTTLPHAKLYYPEPFIASPSYMHSDLIFLNILQY
jgi:hypothetical protein